MLNIISQILGVIAIIVVIISMIFKEKSKILFFSTIYNFLTLTSYILLGRYLGSILVLIATLKTLLYYIFSIKKIPKKNYILIIFEVSIITTSIILWQSWFDIFLLINLVINTYTTWQDDVKIIKIFSVVCCVFLSLYDFFSGAYMYIISELLFGGTALVSLIKTIKQEKEHLNKEETENLNLKIEWIIKI